MITVYKTLSFLNGRDSTTINLKLQDILLDALDEYNHQSILEEFNYNNVNSYLEDNSQEDSHGYSIIDINNLYTLD